MQRGNEAAADELYHKRKMENRRMNARKLILALTLVLGSTPISLAQSQRNYGPSGPATGDSYGEPYSGSAQARAADRYWERHWHLGSWRYRYW